MGYFYYSYFFKLPPLKLSLDKAYDSYTIQFNFLYETNTALRPKNNVRGKKLYLFYSDGFKIWHDYSMNYLGIEDKYGNSYKNLIPNFNTENENLFTITVINEDDIYKGKVFVNGVKIHMPPFTAGSLSYILFCHNDTACPAGNSVFWTSGFYNQIKIYNLKKENSVLNDNSFHDLYIYNNYYSRYNYQNKLQRYNSYPADETIDMAVAGIDYQSISNKQFSIIYSNSEQLQMFNYGIDQTLPLRNSKIAYDNDYYINQYFEETNTCANSLSCYGGSTIYTDEARACDDDKYFKYDKCESFPSIKDKYFSLALPLKEIGAGSELTFTLSNLIQKSVDDIKEGKVTYTFWIKLIGFEGQKDILRFGETTQDYCVLSYEEFNKLLLKCGANGIFYYQNSYEILKENFGKYMHVSIALSFHYYYGAKNAFISFIINNSEVRNVNGNFDGFSYIDIQQLSIFTEIFAQISKFFVYNETLIGGYAFNTNKYFNLEPKHIIIDENNINCVTGYSTYYCIQDYDPAFDDNYYIDTGYPSDNNVLLTQNNMYKIKGCNDTCATSCYGTGDTQCACATNSYFDYIFYDENEKSYQCRKLPYFDFKKYESLVFELSTYDNIGGIDFWFYATKGINDYSSPKLLFKISLDNSAEISINTDSIGHPNCNGDNFVSTCPNEDDMIGNWCHISCKFDSAITNINSITFENNESGLTSPGIMLIRQFKLWNNFQYNKEIFNTAFTESLDRDDIDIILVIDSIIKPDKMIKPLPNPSLGIVNELKSNYPNDVQYFGYSPLIDPIPELDLCLETEECKPIINLVGIKDLTFINITVSGTGRYTMELWLKIKNVARFLSGINIIWRYHVSISAFTDTLKDKLSLYCFPQDYLISLSGKSGRDILYVTEGALNKLNIDLDLTNTDNTWIYMRCAYNWDNEIYYLESNVNKDEVIKKEGTIAKERTYDDNTIDYPYRYLFTYYDSYNAIERVISPIMHRFNTAQRESFNSSSSGYYGSFIFDNIKFDDYDVSEQFTINAIKSSDSCNNKKEGYYYNPHYEIPIKTFDKLETIMPDFLTIREIKHLNDNIYVFTTLQQHFLSIGDKAILYDKINDTYYNLIAVSGCNYNYKVFTCMVYDEETNNECSITERADLSDFILFKMDNLECPSYAKVLKDGTCRIIWRNVLNNGFGNDNDGVEEYPFTNGAFYVNRRVDIYVRRQDPHDLNGLYDSFDIIGNDTNIFNEDNYIKEADIEC